MFVHDGDLMTVSSFCGGGCCAWRSSGSAPWRFIYSESDCIVSFDVESDVVVAVGILGHRAGELFLFGSDLFSLTLETCHRLLQIEIEESRFRRRVCQYHRHDLYPGPHLQRGFFIPLVIANGHHSTRPWCRGAWSVHHHRMEVCGTSHLTTPSLQTSLIISTSMDFLSRGNILLCHYLLPSDIFSSDT